MTVFHKFSQKISLEQQNAGYQEIILSCCVSECHFLAQILQGAR